MKRIPVVILMFMAVTIACSKSKVPTTDTTSTNKAGKAAAEFTGSVVRIDFDNAISHVLGDEIQKIPQPRAVLIQDENHESKLTIMFPSEQDKENIRLAFGRAAICTDACEVSPIDGFRFRVVYGDKNGIQPAFDKDNSFKNTVPHLPLKSLNSKAELPLPDGTDFRAFFDFNGGRLFARPCESKLKFKGDPKGYRVADFVTLSGTTPMPAHLEYTKTGQDPWSKIEFTQSTLVWLIFDNAPQKGDENKPHYHLHKKVGTPGQPFPEVDDNPELCFPKQDYDPDRGVTVACGNTQWP